MSTDKLIAVRTRRHSNWSGSLIGWIFSGQKPSRPCGDTSAPRFLVGAEVPLSESFPITSGCHTTAWRHKSLELCAVYTQVVVQKVNGYCLLLQPFLWSFHFACCPQYDWNTLWTTSELWPKRDWKESRFPQELPAVSEVALFGITWTKHNQAIIWGL